MSANRFWFQFYYRDKEKKHWKALGPVPASVAAHVTRQGKSLETSIKIFALTSPYHLPTSYIWQQINQISLTFNMPKQHESYLPICEQSEQIFSRKTITKPPRQVFCWQITCDHLFKTCCVNAGSDISYFADMRLLGLAMATIASSWRNLCTWHSFLNSFCSGCEEAGGEASTRLFCNFLVYVFVQLYQTFGSHFFTLQHVLKSTKWSLGGKKKPKTKQQPNKKSPPLRIYKELMVPGLEGILLPVYSFSTGVLHYTSHNNSAA